MQRRNVAETEVVVPEIPEPCSEPWDGMAGNARVRHCQVCAADVHNLAAMSAAEIARLLSRPGPMPCIRVSRDAEGRLMTTEPRKDAWRGFASIASSWVAVISAAVAISPVAAQTADVFVGEIASPRHATASITGKLIDEAGHPFGDATIRLLSHGTPLAGSVHAAADGSFTLEAKPGRYSLLVEGAHMVTKTMAVTLVKGKTDLPAPVPVHMVALQPQSTTAMGAPPLPQVTAGMPVSSPPMGKPTPPPPHTVGKVTPRKPNAQSQPTASPAPPAPAVAAGSAPSCGAGAP